MQLPSEEAPPALPRSEEGPSPEDALPLAPLAEEALDPSESRCLMLGEPWQDEYTGLWRTDIPVAKAQAQAAVWPHLNSPPS